MSVEDDLDGVMWIMEAAFEPRWREAWTRAQVRDSLALPSTHLLLAGSGGQELSPGDPAQGFILSRRALDEEELLLIAVHPDHRERGLGSDLIESRCSTSAAIGVKTVFLEMRANNPAQSLYRRCGFEPIGLRPLYYRSADGVGIDAITFARQL